MSNLKVAIIDFQFSNLFSVQHACQIVGLNASITSSPNDISSSDALILPGVGAFGDAMKNLQQFRLIDPIIEHINKKKSFLGVCLGLQLLFEKSEEFGNHKGLGIFQGSVVKFPNKNSKNEMIIIPQIGWNTLKLQKKDPLLSGIKDEEFMYFVHSYYILPKDPKIILAKTVYEKIEYTSAISQNNVFAVQFHPEKSGTEGLKI